MWNVSAAKPWDVTFMAGSVHQPLCSLRCSGEGESEAAKEMWGRFLLAGLPSGDLAWGCLSGCRRRFWGLQWRFWWLTQSSAPSAVPWCWLSPDSEGRDASLSHHHHQMFSFEFPKQDMPRVCLFLSWEIWYQTSAGMAHLFREGFFPQVTLLSKGFSLEKKLG